ncbi:MAG: PadR family transcriptional regulator [Pseudomonadota bacterium]
MGSVFRYIHIMNSHNKSNKPTERDRNPAEYLILGVLSTGEQHGYDLFRTLEEELGLIWTLGRSQTYALLSRMEQAGLVAYNRQAQEKRPDRKNFFLTPAGKKIFNKWVKSPVEHIRDLRLEFLAKIHFLKKGDRKWVEKLIEGQVAVCRIKCSGMEERKRSAPSGLERLTFDFRQVQAKAALDWLQGLQNEFRKE